MEKVGLDNWRTEMITEKILCGIHYKVACTVTIIIKSKLVSEQTNENRLNNKKG